MATRLLSAGTGQRESLHTTYPSLSEGNRACFQRSTRRADIVDQQCPLTNQSIARATERIAHVFLPLPGIEIDLRSGRSLPDQRLLVHRQSNPATHLTGQQRRLIVPSRAMAGRVQRNRHQNIGRHQMPRHRVPGPIRRHQSTQGGSQRSSAAVFELVNRLAKNPLKNHHRSYALDVQWGSATTHAEPFDHNRVSTPGTARGVNSRKLIQALYTQQDAHPAASNTPEGKEQIVKLSAQTAPAQTNRLNDRHGHGHLSLTLPSVRA